MVIRVKADIGGYTTFEQGQHLARLIGRAVNDTGEAVVSFANIDVIPTSFLNGSFVAIVKEMGKEYLYKNVRLVDVSPHIQRMIRERIVSQEHFH